MLKGIFEEEKNDTFKRFMDIVKDKNIEGYVDSTFDVFMMHVAESNNNGEFDISFITNFIKDHIGKDTAIDIRVNYDIILKNVWLIAGGYVTKITIKNDMPILNKNIAKTLIKIVEEHTKK